MPPLDQQTGSRQLKDAVRFTITIVIALLSANLVQAKPSREVFESRSKFKAAVYAHMVIGSFDPHPVSRARAVEKMKVNLREYSWQAERAKQQGADIIVFPEDGIYGLTFSRDTIYPYLEQIPDPNLETWVPCDDPNRHPDSDVQKALSCTAKKNQIYLVANMGDKQPCDPKHDPACPKDGRYQFNTDVAYGPDGKFLTKYHKYNLYFEYQFDKPHVSFSYFDTPFGRFGMMTCFDILFKQPGTALVEKYNITNLAFPTGWMDALPLLPAVGFHSSFARAHGINVLAANLHLPEFGFDGTGLYGPDGAHAYYYGAGLSGLLPKLLVAEMDVIEKPRQKVDFNKPTGNSEVSRFFQYLKNKKNNLHHVSASKRFAQRFLNQNQNLHYLSKSKQPVHHRYKIEEFEDKISSNKRLVQHFASTKQAIQPLSNNYYASSPRKDLHTVSSFDIAPSSYSKDDTFESVLFHDIYTFKVLEKSSGHINVCAGEVCCDLEYQKSTTTTTTGTTTTYVHNSSTTTTNDNSNSNIPELFAFGVFDGLHTHHGDYYMQNCALVKCAKADNKTSCGSPTNTSSTQFSKLRVSGTFQTPNVYPQVVLSDSRGRLGVSGPGVWNFNGTSLQTTELFNDAVLTAILIGRDYSRD